jgi:hypothetical protein
MTMAEPAHRWPAMRSWSSTLQAQSSLLTARARRATVASSAARHESQQLRHHRSAPPPEPPPPCVGDAHPDLELDVVLVAELCGIWIAHHGLTMERALEHLNRRLPLAGYAPDTVYVSAMDAIRLTDALGRPSP